MSQKLASFHLILSLAISFLYVDPFFLCYHWRMPHLPLSLQAKPSNIRHHNLQNIESCEASLGRINRTQEGDTITTSRIYPQKRYAEANHIYSLRKKNTHHTKGILKLNVLGWQRNIYYDHLPWPAIVTSPGS